MKSTEKETCEEEEEEIEVPLTAPDSLFLSAFLERYRDERYYSERKEGGRVGERERDNGE